MRDPIVDEVRKAREEYARRFNFDLDAICRDLRQKQQSAGGQTFALPKRPVRCRHDSEKTDQRSRNELSLRYGEIHGGLDEYPKSDILAGCVQRLGGSGGVIMASSGGRRSAFVNLLSHRGVLYHDLRHCHDRNRSRPP